METLGQKLTAAREKKKMTISRAAALTRIKVQHLELMENDDFSTMPAPTYAKGFLRIYAELLSIDPEPLVREYVEKHLDRNAGRVVSPSHGKKIRAERKKENDSDAASFKFMKQLKGFFQQVAKKLPNLAPRLPQIIAALLGVFVLVGIVRCTVRVAGEENKKTHQSSLLDKRAIMKEPPVHYLELPTTEDKQP